MEEYIVIFVNYDGKELYKTTVKSGGNVTYKGPTPSKPEEVFVGWNKPLTNITDNLIITAVFEKAKDSSLKLAAIAFEKKDKDIDVIDSAVISNEDLHKHKETDIER